MDPRIAAIEKEYVRKDLPSFSPGDTVRVRVRVREGDKERVQPFEGVCIARRGAGVNATFTLRRVSGGVGVERIFPLHSPWIAGLEVVRRGDVRRAKLYYLRLRKGKRARVRERKWWLDKPGAGVGETAEAEEEGGLGAAVAGAFETAKEAVGDVAESVGDVVEDVVEKVKDVAEDVAEKVEDVVEDVVEAVTGHDDEDEEKRSAGDDAAE